VHNVIHITAVSIHSQKYLIQPPILSNYKEKWNEIPYHPQEISFKNDADDFEMIVALINSKC